MWSRTAGFGLRVPAEDNPSRDNAPVDDWAYAEALFAILTNPTPTGIRPDDPYGAADDGIDRSDGFGRDVVVESIDVVYGEHGAEFDVAFCVAIPAYLVAEGWPDRGSTRLPADREWRELSGLEDPGAYAPRVASRVFREATTLVDRRRSRAHGYPTAPPGTNWPRLINILRGEGTVAEIAPGRIEVESPDGVITVLVTPEQWEVVVASDLGEDYDYRHDLFGPDHEKYLVFYDGELVWSSRENLPPIAEHFP